MSIPLPLIDLGSPEQDLADLPAVPVPSGEPTPAAEARGVVWAAAGVLFGYPDAALVAALPSIEEVLGAVAPAVGDACVDPLLHLAGWLRSRPLLVTQADYVGTFDTKRRCCPYLTYYLHGDTRRRGLALWRVKAALQACGFEPSHGELPDHLAVLCELAAAGDESVALALFGEHRAGLALLRAALEKAGSPYAGVVAVVEGLLPADGVATEAAYAQAARQAASGPPAELVGLPGRLAPFVKHEDPDDRGARR